MHETEPLQDSSRVSRPFVPTRERTEETSEPATSREGLPPGYRMRADSHYVDHLESRTAVPTVRLIATTAIDAEHSNADAPSAAFLESIRHHGILQPLLVSPSRNRFRLIAGQKRLAAAVAAGMRDVPCLVHQVDADEAQLMTLATNVAWTKRTATGPGAALAAAQVSLHAAHDELAEALGALVSCASLLNSGSPLAQRTAADLVHAEATRALDLLVAVRSLATERPMARVPVPVATLLRRVARSSTVAHRLRGIIVTVAPSVPETVNTRGDQQLLGAALSGLIAATAGLIAGTSGATVTLGVLGPRHGAVTLTVTQTSVAIPAAWLVQAFDTPWPLSAGATALVHMQAARRIAADHGGDAAASQIDGGTRLDLTLPVAVPA